MGLARVDGAIVAAVVVAGVGAGAVGVETRDKDWLFVVREERRQ